MIDVTKYIVKTEEGQYYVDMESLSNAVIEDALTLIPQDLSKETWKFRNEVVKIVEIVTDDVIKLMYKLTGIEDRMFKIYFMIQVGAKLEEMGREEAMNE